MFLVFLLDLFFLNKFITDAVFPKALQKVRTTANICSQPVQCGLLTKLEEAEAKVRLETLLCVAATQTHYLTAVKSCCSCRRSHL